MRTSQRVLDAVIRSDEGSQIARVKRRLAAREETNHLGSRRRPAFPPQPSGRGWWMLRVQRVRPYRDPPTVVIAISGSMILIFRTQLGNYCLGREPSPHPVTARVASQLLWCLGGHMTVEFIDLKVVLFAGLTGLTILAVIVLLLRRNGRRPN